MRLGAICIRALSWAALAFLIAFAGSANSQVTLIGLVCAIALQPASAVLSVDGEPAAFEADGALLLNAGEHTLRATATGHREAVRTLDVRGVEQEPWNFSLEIALVRQTQLEGTSAVDYHLENV